VRLFHFRDDITVANDNTAKRDQLFDVIWAKLSDSVDFAKVVRAHLDDLVITELIVVHVVVSILVVLSTDVVHVQLFEDLRDDQIENGDNVGWVILDLPVKHLIKLEHMVTINFEHVAVELSDFLELLDIVGSLLILLIILIIIVVLDLLKVVDEILELHLDLRGIDISSPKHHGVG